MTIHRTDCVNVLNLPESERVRLIDAEWQAEDNGGSLYRGDQRLRKQPYRSSGGYLQDLYRAEDRPCGDERENEQAGTASIDVTFDVHNNEELNSIIEKVRQVESVIDIQRSRG